MCFQFEMYICRNTGILRSKCAVKYRKYMEETLKMFDLDRVDRKILKLLQTDGRLKNAELAKK